MTDQTAAEQIARLRADALAEVTASVEASRAAQIRVRKACQAAFEAGVNRGDVAEAAGYSSRDGLYKLLRREGRF